MQTAGELRVPAKKFSRSLMHQTTMILCALVLIICVVTAYVLRGSAPLSYTFGMFALLLALFAVSHPRCARETRENFDNADEVLPLELVTKLKLYLSCLGANSYAPGAGVWRDISGQTDTSHSCNETADRTFLFSDAPTFDDVRAGLNVKGVVITGPKSEDVGLFGNNDFTVYWYSANNAALTAAVPVFVLYANTQGNVALRVSIQQTGATCQMVIENSLDDGAAPSSSTIALSGSFQNSGAPCSFAVVRSAGTLQAYFNDAAQGAPIPCGDAKILLSNRNCAVNPSGTWDANLLVFALYQRALAQADVAKITAYILKRRVVLDDQYKALLAQTNALAAAKVCPFTDAAVCNVQCASVTDWSDPTDMLKNTGVECKAAINTYCKANPGDKFCGCWQDVNKDTAACQVMRSYFDTSLTVSQQCDVRKLYPNTEEPNLDKYYTALNTGFSAAVTGSGLTPLTDLIRMPDDVVVNWQEKSPFGASAKPAASAKSAVPVAKLPAASLANGAIPNDRVVDVFSTPDAGVVASQVSSVSVASLTAAIKQDLQNLFATS